MLLGMLMGMLMGMLLLLGNVIVIGDVIWNVILMTFQIT